MLWVVVFLACAPGQAPKSCDRIVVEGWPGLTACEIDRPAVRREVAQWLADTGRGDLTLDRGTCTAETPPPPAAPGELA